MNKQQIQLVSVGLQPLAGYISDQLRKLAGEHVGFSLVVATGFTAQYVSNCKREDGIMLMRDLIAQWSGGRADIPAHYNPDIQPGQQPDKAEQIKWFEQQAANLIKHAESQGLNLAIEQRPKDPLAMRSYEFVPVVWEKR